MSNLAIKQANYQDIIDLPENIVGEIINGQLETHPRPAPKHAVAASSIGAELVSAYSHWLLIGAFANDQAVSIAPFAEHTFLLSDLWE